MTFPARLIMPRLLSMLTREAVYREDFIEVLHKTIHSSPPSVAHNLRISKEGQGYPYKHSCQNQGVNILKYRYKQILHAYLLFLLILLLASCPQSAPAAQHQ